MDREQPTTASTFRAGRGRVGPRVYTLYLWSNRLHDVYTLSSRNSQRVYSFSVPSHRPKNRHFYRFDCKPLGLQLNLLDFWPPPNQDRVKKPNLRYERQP